MRWTVIHHTYVPVYTVIIAYTADFGVARVLDRTSVANSFCGECVCGVHDVLSYVLCIAL